ncbi:glycoside hydrolase family 6 protein [Cellulomonas sp. NPDC057328]|uniref:glycoside hydrolase family 6 protein n=1 Tax=Cellulomonas sp. NPDC057328 TaxID=3346101 RepID=UPI0036339AE7
MPALAARRAVSAVVVLLLLAATLAVAAPAPATAATTVTTASDRLLPGRSLAVGGVLRSVGSAHVLAMGGDGDVTLSLAGRVLWHTGTTGNPGAVLVQQPGGALEVRSRAGALLWTTGTVSPGARTVVKPDGVLYTISTAGTVAWKSASGVGAALRTTGTDRVLPGGLLLPRESVVSPDGTVSLTMGADGALTLTVASRTTWRTPTARAGASAVMAPEGDLRVVAPDGATVWSSGTSSPGARLVVKDHGRAYLISAAHASVWTNPETLGERVPTVVHLPLPEALPLPASTPTPTPAPTAASTPTPTPSPSPTSPLWGPRPSSPLLTGAPSDPTPSGSTPSGSTAPEPTASGPIASAPATPEAAPAVHRTVLASAPPYADPGSPAARAAAGARAEGRTADAALLDKAAAQGSARWLGPQDPTATVGASVRAYAQAATAAGRTPVLVTYAIPDRDCGGHSAGGFATAAEYAAWVDAVAAGLAGARAVVVVEPDALLHLDRCGDRDARLAMLRHAVAALTGAGAEVYLDAASSNSFGWGTVSLRDMALRLRAAGVDDAAGFAVNTSNFQRTEHEVAYGTYLSALLGGASFVVDTSRNGNGPLAGPDGTVWCNPSGRALGAPAGATDGGPHVANLWVKTVGLSDGSCNGGPPAGQPWESYLLGLAAAAAW